MRLVLSFDVEEHDRIEAAAGLQIDPALKDHYRERVGESTRWLIDLLAEADILATFFVVGEIAEHDPDLIRAIATAGHEVASHGWDHRRVQSVTPRGFRDDVRRSKETLEAVAGKAVVGYRAPTFSVIRQTAWALDVLAELGMAYDSSVYPVRHDRYGVPGAPRGPFLAQGEARSILELPPATLRVAGMTIPMGGGGYFRLFPLWVTERAIRQTLGVCNPSVAVLYFHPWEFDSEQMRLPLRGLNRYRTYVGLGRTRRRLARLLSRYRFARAADVARDLSQELDRLPVFAVGGPETAGAKSGPHERLDVA
jgi:polysaccharide deacetylase family protein (PEP-CTERM system associated)